MQYLKSLIGSIALHFFIIATGIAAMIHSTWSLSTFFNGPEPSQNSAQWLAWVTTGFLVALAIDIGQIAISVHIAAGNRKRVEYLAFATLAVATYYLQWLYIASHMPAIALGTGVNPAVAPVAAGFRDAALWVLPAMLPISTTLYTFGYGKVRRAQPVNVTYKRQQTEQVTVQGPDFASLQAANPSANSTSKTELLAPPQMFVQTCSRCNRVFSAATELGAKRALSGHLKNCKARVENEINL